MKYNGITNIWLDVKDLTRYPNNSNDFMAIDRLKCRKGYCFLARSKTINNISLDYCIDMEHKKITNNNLHSFNTNDIILCKLPNWNTYIPGRILNIVDSIQYGNEESWCFNNKLSIDNNVTMQFGNGYFNLYFPCCPDSDIYLTWHYGNLIMRERSMLTYKNIVKNNIINEEKKENRMKKSKSYESFAPFCFNESDSDSDSEEINNCVEDMIIKVIDSSKPKYILHSGLFDKKDSIKSELLRYNLAWLKIANDYNEKYINISKKPVNISYNNIDHTFLSNVAVIYPNHFNDIIKIQVANNIGCKIINKERFHLKDRERFIEPQDYNFFKKMPGKNIYFFDNKTYLYTYTGILCFQAKQYLFNINKIDIK